MAPRGDALTLGVVVPTLDEAEHVAPLIERLLRAPGDDRADRVIVADGGSSDSTLARAARAGAEVLVATRGRGFQLAAGAARLDCDVLLFVHADCMPGHGALARLRDAFAQPGLLAAALSQRIDARGGFFRSVEWCANRRVDWLGSVYGDSALAVRAATYREVGGYPPWPLFEDVELSRRLRRVSRPRRLRDAHVLVSARRWRREGCLRATVRNWLLLGAFAVGVEPSRLARYYPAHANRARTS